MTHEEVQMEIPAYLASRLEGEALARVEAHLRSCEACADLIADLNGLAPLLAEEGEALFEPHPQHQQLRAYAQGWRPDHGADAERLARHLSLCTSCELQVEAWSRPPILEQERSVQAGPSGPRRLVRAGMGALLIAAGLVLGVALSLRFGGGPPDWQGPVHLPVLRLPTRGQEQANLIRVRRGQPQIVLAVPFPPEDGPLDNERLVLQVLKQGGTAVYTLRGSAAELTALAEESGVIPVMIPAHVLTAGPYDIAISREGSPREPLVRIPCQVARED